MDIKFHCKKSLFLGKAANKVNASVKNLICFVFLVFVFIASGKLLEAIVDDSGRVSTLKTH